MSTILSLLLSAVLSNFRDRASLQLELIALRHQIAVLERKRTTRPRLARIDRFFWVWLYRLWPGCLDIVVIVKPNTVIGWHRMGFRLFWTWKSRRRHRGRPQVPQEVRALIRRMSRENPLWGAPRVHGELLKLGIEISQATVSKYMISHRCPPSQTWKTFLANHADDLVSIDLFVVPTVSFRVLYAFIVLRHDRRRVVHFDVTSHPTAAWLRQQLVEAFPWETAPRYLIRDRDSAYGAIFRDRLEAMNIVDVPTAPRSPWQNAYVERVIGSIRRECLDHVIVLNARHLRRILSSYFDYYHRSRTHLSLDKDCPEPRPACPPGAGKIIAFPQVGGLHYRYERLAA
jgi:transposase InsO family protein